MSTRPPYAFIRPPPKSGYSSNTEGSSVDCAADSMFVHCRSVIGEVPRGRVALTVVMEMNRADGVSSNVDVQK